jgi:hypothetical protein
MNTIQSLNLAAGYTYFTQLLVLLLQVIYVLFAFMLTRQIKLMNHNFQTSAAPLFSLLAWINFLASLGILALSILSF